MFPRREFIVGWVFKKTIEGGLLMAFEKFQMSSLQIVMTKQLMTEAKITYESEVLSNVK